MNNFSRALERLFAQQRIVFWCDAKSNTPRFLIDPASGQRFKWGGRGHRPESLKTPKKAESTESCLSLSSFFLLLLWFQKPPPPKFTRMGEQFHAWPPPKNPP